MLTHRIHLPDGTQIEFFASEHYADDFPNMFDFSGFPAYPSNWRKAQIARKKKREAAMKKARKLKRKARQKQRA